MSSLCLDNSLFSVLAASSRLSKAGGSRCGMARDRPALQQPRHLRRSPQSPAGRDSNAVDQLNLLIPLVRFSLGLF